MKRLLINSIIIGLTSLSLASCSGYLDKTNYSQITPEQVWQEPKLINAVLVNLYDNIQTESFDYWYSSAWRLMNPTSMSDEAQGSFQKDPCFDNGNASWTYADDLFDVTFATIYKYIRNCNDFIAQVNEATSLTETTKNQLLAEGRFIRAMHYFTLVKRYGGVPLIDASQTYDSGDLENLQVARNKESEVYDFIISECQEAAKSLPATRDAAEKYQATKYAALALCSRAALYAGSIAKYGTVQLDGIVGIDSSKASTYFQTCLEASNQIIDDGKYSLYNKDHSKDLSQGYCDMFLKGNGDNGEYIFQRQYNVAAGKGHSWDKRNAPFSYRGGGWGCGMAITLEMVESYENTDGTISTLKVNDANGNPIRYDDPIDLFQNKDPRLLASVYVPGGACQTTKIEWRRGVISKDGTKYQATQQPSSDPTIEVDGVKLQASGKDGGADAGDASKTGFYQKKFFDETLTDMNMSKSETPWPIFRLGEIYLNKAEAAFELGKTGDASTAIKAIRDRVGMPEITNITLDKIRHERKIELAFEGHRYWDLKRWHLASKDVSEGGLNGFRGSALYPWYNLSDGKWTFERSSNTPKETRYFIDKNYYVKINSSDMNSNPKLVQNPGYTN